MIAGCATAVWLPASFLIAGLLGRFTMGAGIAMLGVLVTGHVAATQFQRLKRGRPNGYYQQLLRLKLEDAGLHRSGFVRRSGVWDVRRTCRALSPRD